MYRAVFFVLTFMLLNPALLQSQSGRILMDGEFSDWDGVSYLYEDAVGDVGRGNLSAGFSPRQAVWRRFPDSPPRLYFG